MTFPFTVGGTFARPKFSLKGGARSRRSGLRRREPANIVNGISGLFKKKQQ